MSTLILLLQRNKQVISTLKLPAESVIETTLTVTPEHANLPTLISVENVIEQINKNGLELASSSEIERIAKLINSYYLPTPKTSWKDKKLLLSVKKISLSKEQYKEIQDIRSSMKKASREVIYYKSKRDLQGAKKAQDEVAMKIARSAEKHPSWWKKEIPKFLAKTTLGILLDTVVGIPLGMLVRRVIG